MAFFLPISPEKQAKELGEAGNYLCSLTCCDVFGLSWHLNFGFEQVLACLGLCAPELKAAQNGVRYERKWAGDLCEPAVHADSGRWRCSLKVELESDRRRAEKNFKNLIKFLSNSFKLIPQLKLRIKVNLKSNQQKQTA